MPGGDGAAAAPPAGPRGSIAASVEFTLHLEKPMGIGFSPLPGGGMEVRDVEAGSHAATAGVGDGDVLVSIANQPALSGTPDELMAMLIAAPSPVALTFLRQGATAPPGSVDASAAAAAEVAAAADAASRSATPSDPPPAAAPAPATSDGGGGRRGSTGYGRAARRA